jgi:hypothetical protein
MNELSENLETDQNKDNYKENYCDIIMKGGITSGIVYPEAIAELARYYRLKNIGGTSAGALAACIAAAAEFQRSNNTADPDAGYKIVAGLADELPRKNESAQEKKISTLFGLFQPSDTTAPFFKILEATLNKEKRRTRLGVAVLAGLWAYKRVALRWLVIGFAVALVFLSLAQSLTSCGLLRSWALVLELPVALVFVLLILGYPLVRLNLEHVPRTAEDWKTFVTSKGWKNLLQFRSKDWKKRVVFSVIALATSTYFIVQIACAVALLPAVVLGALLATIAVSFALYSLLIEIVNNEDFGFGLCTGMPPKTGSKTASEYKEYKALTPWLHEKIQRAAGLTIEDDPLTFGDLWNAKGFPPDWLPDLESKKAEEKKSINLQLVTTNLTHGRPYLLPFDDEHARVFFKYDELMPFFPLKVLDFIKEKAEKARADKNEEHYSWHDKNILELPSAKDLPVLFAARLSLSFPGLLSAIPLYTIDEEPEMAQRKLERCWFSDGGISSNFPIHFFDGFLPIWPTFGFTLDKTLKCWPEREVGMPESNTEGREEAWNRFHEKKDFERLMGFGDAILNAARNWNDNTLTRMPGVRERVVHIYLDPKKEGGLNLNMSDQIIGKLICRGKKAAAEIIKRYVVGEQIGKKKITMDFENHAWIRLNTLADMFSSHIPELGRALNGKQKAVCYRALIAGAQARNQEQYPLTDSNDIARLNEFVDLLLKLSNLSGDIVQDRSRPLPKGALRGRPLL